MQLGLHTVYGQPSSPKSRLGLCAIELYTHSNIVLTCSLSNQQKLDASATVGFYRSQVLIYEASNNWETTNAAQQAMCLVSISRVIAA